MNNYLLAIEEENNVRKHKDAKLTSLINKWERLFDQEFKEIAL